MLSALGRSATLATRRPRVALWTVLALSSALFVVGIAVIAGATVDRFTWAHPGSHGNLVVYLGDGVDETRANALVRELGALHGVERAELLSAVESANRLYRALGSDPALLDGVDLASLPASVEVRLAPGVRDLVAMSPTLRALRNAPGVDDIVVEDRGEDRLAEVVPAIRTAAWTIAALFAGIGLVIVLAAVRVGLDRSPQETAVLRLLGASPGFVAIPSALAGALYGAVAAAAAVLGLGLVLWGHLPQLGAVALAPPPDVGFGGLIGFGGLVGFIGGGLAGVTRAR
ncbi:MAG TPA: permease-like cell division protein FtsX [Kofleriaceae bacterium]|nr:permease-like cell division protein FtsX [Kofleriaceae bacterium]